MIEATKRPHAWGGLEELRPMLRSYLVWRCRDEGECEDLIQEALLRAARFRGSTGQPDNLRAWTLRIASNLLCDRHRNDRRLRIAEVDEELMEPPPGPSEEEDPLFEVDGAALERDWLLGELRRSVAGLREEDRLVLDAFYAAGRGCREIGHDLGLSPGLVKVRLFRARRKLAALLRQRIALAEQSATRPALP